MEIFENFYMKLDEITNRLAPIETRLDVIENFVQKHNDQDLISIKQKKYDDLIARITALEARESQNNNLLYQNYKVPNESTTSAIQKQHNQIEEIKSSQSDESLSQSNNSDTNDQDLSANKTFEYSRLIEECSLRRKNSNDIFNINNSILKDLVSK
jgi:hypothetical protein